MDPQGILETETKIVLYLCFRFLNCLYCVSDLKEKRVSSPACRICMADHCVACKAPLKSWEASVFLCSPQDNLLMSPKGLCLHEKCFICSVCGTSLEQNDFHVDAGTRFYCSQHGRGASSQIRFLPVLSEFLARSKTIKRVLDSDVNKKAENIEGGKFRVDEEFNSCNSCTSHPFIESVCGYWIECVEKRCPERKLLSKDYGNEARAFCDLGSAGNSICATFAPEEIYQNYFYGSKHWNYCTKEDDVGPVILTIKQEFRHSKDFIR